MKIITAGTGYVSLCNAILLAQHNEVVAIDIGPEKVAMIDRKQSPIEDAEIEDYLQNKLLNLRARLNKQEANNGAKIVIIATHPTSNAMNDIENMMQKKKTRSIPLCGIRIQYRALAGLIN